MCAATAGSLAMRLRLSSSTGCQYLLLCSPWLYALANTLVGCAQGGPQGFPNPTDHRPGLTSPGMTVAALTQPDPSGKAEWTAFFRNAPGRRADVWSCMDAPESGCSLAVTTVHQVPLFMCCPNFYFISEIA